MLYIAPTLTLCVSCFTYLITGLMLRMFAYYAAHLLLTINAFDIRVVEGVGFHC
jgi:hypothetical protein